ncbi:MAG TPA: type II toxin-antitoxin system PemK/MazF family toxin, partial [Anaerolineae bacterium]|nr:type II toxin-antitoxin system PemK/MazF family toxin [Anaerolineae bacterium]
VVIPFPFSDLSATKLRPAVVLMETGRGDWLLCQITSNPYSDPKAVRITDEALKEGLLRAVSFARPLKLFTANESLMTKRVAVLNEQTFRAILSATIHALQQQLP